MTKWTYDMWRVVFLLSFVILINAQNPIDCMMTNNLVFQSGETTVSCTGTLCQNCNIMCHASTPCTVNCDSDNSCQGITMHCSDTAACTLNCPRSESCRSATLHQGGSGTTTVTCGIQNACTPSFQILESVTYTTTGSLTVGCTHDTSCFGMAVTCPQTGSCGITCGAQNSCNGIVQSANDNGGLLTLDCNNADSCANGVFTCARNGNCNINCNAASACFPATITCPESGNCMIDCNNANSCGGGGDTTTIATSGSGGGTVTLTCDTTNACQRMSGTFSTISTVTVTCSTNACTDASFNCATVTDSCVVTCSQNGCSSLTMDCPASSIPNGCQLNCPNTNSCTAVDTPLTGLFEPILCASGACSTSVLSNPGALTEVSAGSCPITFPSTVGGQLTCTGTDCQNCVITCDDTHPCNIICSDAQSCTGLRVICGDSSDCNIRCSNTDACMGATIEQGGTGATHVHCSAANACNGAMQITRTVTHSSSTGSLTVDCSAPSACVGILAVTCPLNADCTINCLTSLSCSALSLPSVAPHTGSLILNCDGPNSCQNSAITCNSATCNMNCGGIRSCFPGSSFTCPVTGACTIACTGIESCGADSGAVVDVTKRPGTTGTLTLTCTANKACRRMTASCPEKPGTCNVQCSEQQSCSAMTLNGATDGGALTQLCTGENSCEAMTSECPVDDTCVITCSNTRSCFPDTSFTCPRNYDCPIECSGIESCGGSAAAGAGVVVTKRPGTFGTLTLTCTANKACRRMTATCPEKPGTCNVQCSEQQSCSAMTLNGATDGGALTQLCTGENSCEVMTSECPVDDTCVITCSNTRSCFPDTSFTCPRNYDCPIECSGIESCGGSASAGAGVVVTKRPGTFGTLTLTCTANKACRRMTATCPEKPGTCNVQCSEQQSCSAMTLNGATDGGALTQLCTGENSCEVMTSECPVDDTCVITCSNTRSCFPDTSFTCPRNYDCPIECSGIESCGGSASAGAGVVVTKRPGTFGTLTLTCTANRACRRMTASCPEKPGTCNVQCSEQQSCSAMTLNGATDGGALTQLCTGENSCEVMTSECPVDDTCVITCSNTRSCFPGTSFTCPRNYDCPIECSGIESCGGGASAGAGVVVTKRPGTFGTLTLNCTANRACRRMTASCPEKPGTCNVQCSEQQSCSAMTLNGATDGGALTQLCTGENSCEVMTSECPVDDTCVITCSNTRSCFPGTSFTCPRNYDCPIECSGIESCGGSASAGAGVVVTKRPGTFGTLTLTCTANKACRRMTATCPEKPGTCNVQCSEQQSCSAMTLNGATDGGALTQLCTGENSCEVMTSECPVDDTCVITCSNTRSCFPGTSFTCPRNYDCPIECSGIESCGGSASAGAGVVVTKRPGTFGTLTLTCTANRACRRMTASCPEKPGTCNVQCSEQQSCSAMTLNGATDGGALTQLCTGENSCEVMTSECPVDDACDITCSGARSCTPDARFTCPTTGDCNILCTGVESCGSETAGITTILNRAGATGTLTLACNGQDSCRRMTADCPGTCDLSCIGITACTSMNARRGSDEGPMNMNCDGVQSCTAAIIQCPTTFPCNVTCTGDRSCFGTAVNCPASADCSFSCAGTTACSGSGAPTNIRTTGAATGSVFVNCNGDRVCRGIQVSCPEKPGECHVTCEDSQSCSGLSVNPATDGGPLTMKCMGQTSCGGGGNIGCPSAAICDISCSNSLACYNTDITCPVSATCSVRCEALNACGASSGTPSRIIQPASGTGTLDLDCTESLSCQRMSVQCPRAPGQCNIDCSGPSSCLAFGVISNSGGPLTLECSNIASCSSGTVTCPEVSTCVINCDTTDSCSNMNQAQTGSPTGQLTVGCGAASSCSSIRLACAGIAACNVDCSTASSCASITVNSPSNGGPFTLGCGESSCSSGTIVCPGSSNCAITCSGNNACFPADITCPATGDCSIMCSTSSSCGGSTVGTIVRTTGVATGSVSVGCTAADSCTNIDVTCPETPGVCDIDCLLDDSCTSITVQAASTNGGPLVLECAGDSSCSGGTLECPTAASCGITCSGASSCFPTTITCPDTAICTVLCTGSASCGGPTSGPTTLSHHNTGGPGGSVVLVCSESNSCERIQHDFEGIEDVSVSCTATDACNSAVFDCDQVSRSCSVKCHYPGTCVNADVRCPAVAPSLYCELSCQGLAACDPITVSGTVIPLWCSTSDACSMDIIDNRNPIIPLTLVPTMAPPTAIPTNAPPTRSPSDMLPVVTFEPVPAVPVPSTYPSGKLTLINSRSSTQFDALHTADLVVDGDHNSFLETSIERFPYWEAEFADGEVRINSITIYNSPGQTHYLRDFYIIASKVPFPTNGIHPVNDASTMFTRVTNTAGYGDVHLELSGFSARYIRIQLVSDIVIMRLAEVYVTGFAEPSVFIENTETSYSQLNGELISLRNGGFASVWQSDRQDGSGYGVYLQIHDGSGGKIGSETHVVQNLGSQENPSGASQTTGIIIAFEQYSGLSREVCFRQFSTSMTVCPSTTLLLAGEKSAPKIAVLNDDSFIMIWVESEISLKAERYDSSGTSMGIVATITNSGRPVSHPGIIYELSGEFVICYHAYYGGADRYDIVVQHFSMTLQPGIEFKANTVTAHHQKYPAIVARKTAPNYGYTLTWSSVGQDGSAYGVIAKTFTSAGVVVGSESQLNTITAGNQRRSALAVTGNDEVAVVWESQSGGQLYDIMMCTLDSLSSCTSTPTVVNTFTSFSQFHPKIASLQGFGYVTSWVSDKQDGHHLGIYSRLFFASPADPERLTTAAGVSSPRVIRILGGPDGIFYISCYYSPTAVCCQKFNEFLVTVSSEVCPLSISGVTSLSLVSTSSLGGNGFFTICYTTLVITDLQVTCQEYQADLAVVAGAADSIVCLDTATVDSNMFVIGHPSNGNQAFCSRSGNAGNVQVSTGATLHDFPILENVDCALINNDFICFCDSSDMSTSTIRVVFLDATGLTSSSLVYPITATNQLPRSNPKVVMFSATSGIIYYTYKRTAHYRQFAVSGFTVSLVGQEESVTYRDSVYVGDTVDPFLSYSLLPITEETNSYYLALRESQYSGVKVGKYVVGNSKHIGKLSLVGTSEISVSDSGVVDLVPYLQTGFAVIFNDEGRPEAGLDVSSVPVYNAALSGGSSQQSAVFSSGGVNRVQPADQITGNTHGFALRFTCPAAVTVAFVAEYLVTDGNGDSMFVAVDDIPSNVPGTRSLLTMGGGRML